MSSPDEIDALVVARRVLANPKTFRLSTHETLAMAGCLVGLDEQLDRLEAGPTTNARLAAAVAAVLQQRERIKGVNAGDFGVFIQADALLATITTLKTIFEEEFPHVGS